MSGIAARIASMFTVIATGTITEATPRPISDRLRPSGLAKNAVSERAHHFASPPASLTVTSTVATALAGTLPSSVTVRRTL